MRSFLTGIWPALALLCAASTAVATDRPDESTARIESWIQQLGDDSYEQRQAATERLIELGPPAKEALVEGLRDPDAEIRSRCRRILNVVLDLDHEQRVDAFAADTTGRDGHGLPGWRRYRQLAGDDPAARELFVAMQRDEPYLIEVSESAPQFVADAFQVRCEQLQQEVFATDLGQRQSVSLGTVAALFFVASNGQVAVSDQMVSYLHSFSYQPTFQQTLQEGAADRFAPPLRKLLGAWVGRSTTSLSNYQNFVLALRYDLSEALRPALDALQTEQGKPHVLHYALFIVGRFGGPEHLDAVESLLADSDVCGTFHVDDLELPTEVRDLALAVALHLTAQDHEEYGYAALRRNPQLLFLPNTIGFRTSAARESALQKWRAWRSERAAADAVLAPAY